ncbi:MAG: response regulator receiver sensor signal transduction histidine kinase [Verrucomicrobiaceae bacterium]|nr:response regulator receiver sensor signal transduction histidine kinase [Verrucomicrobiaceae bacterium]
MNPILPRPLGRRQTSGRSAERLVPEPLANTFPMNPSDGVSGSRPPPLAKAQRGTILVVDDRPRNVELLGTLLATEGYEVIVALDGNQALDCVARKVPDLILLDVMMPEMDGFEVCQRLKRNPRTAEVAIIFLSASGDKDSIIRGIELGGVDYLTKPFVKAELLARVNTHVTLHHLLDRNRSLLQARHRLVAEEMEDMKRPLRAIVQNLGDLARVIQPAASAANRLLGETLTLANDALGHLSRELNILGGDGSAEPSSVFPVPSKQLEEMIGKWYLSARRRRINFSIGRMPQEVHVACHLLPLTYLVDLVMAANVNSADGGDSIQGRLRLEGGRLTVTIVRDSSKERKEEAGRDAESIRWSEPSELDQPLVQEAERQGATLHFGTLPTGEPLMALSLPLLSQPT